MAAQFDIDHEDAKILLQIVAQILLSDMALTETESEFLDHVADELGIGQTLLGELVGAVNLHDPIVERVNKVSVEAHPVLLRLVQEAADADGVIEPMEAKLLAKIREAVGS